MSEGGGEDGHDRERTKCAGEDDTPRMPHCQYGGDEERFVPNLRRDDHGKTLNKDLEVGVRILDKFCHVVVDIVFLFCIIVINWTEFNKPWDRFSTHKQENVGIPQCLGFRIDIFC